LLLGVAVAALLDSPSLGRGVLFLLPCLLLALALLWERYPGERIIARAARRRRRRGRRPAPELVGSCPATRTRSRPGRLIAKASAPRAPPRLRSSPRLARPLRKETTLSKKHAIVAAAAVAALAAPAASQAHVSLHPNVLPAGDFPTVDIRVPNETDNATTTRVDVKIPPGFTAFDPQRVPGWKIQLVKTKLSKPIQTDDGPVTEEVAEAIFTATKGGGTPPGYIENFPVAFSVPGKSGDTLTFKTVQTYSNGQVVRWIGAPSADQPAPTVNVGPENGATYDLAGDAGPPAGQVAPAATSAAHTPAPTSGSAPAKSTGASKGLAIAALIVGALGLLAGIAALVSRRRPSQKAEAELSRQAT
jgi:periplasmic copper chaperone A